MSHTRPFVTYCLQEAGISLADLDYVVFYDKPLVKFERLLETYLSYVPRGFRSFVAAMPVWLKDKLFLKSTLKKELAALGGISENDLSPLLAALAAQDDIVLVPRLPGPGQLELMDRAGLRRPQFVEFDKMNSLLKFHKPAYFRPWPPLGVLASMVRGSGPCSDSSPASATSPPCCGSMSSTQISLLRPVAAPMLAVGHCFHTAPVTSQSLVASRQP